MAGLDRILERIAADGQRQAEAIQQRAEAEAGQILAEAEAEAKKFEEAEIEAANRKADEMRLRAESSAKLDGRKAILAAKREMIRRVFEDTEKKLSSLPEEEYAGFLARRLSSAGEGEVLFAENDRQIAPRVMALAGRKDSFSLTDEINRGFLVKNGAVSSDYSLSEMVRFGTSDLEAAVAGILFPKN